MPAVKKRFNIGFLHFFLCWLLLNLLQASFTELTSDEGYYWFYSRSLEWGYYDHPPFVALMVKVGYSIFKNELGVRLFNVLINAGSLLILFKLILPEYKANNNTWIILFSIPLLHYLAFITFPDGALLFFSTVYLYLYKKFIEQQKIVWTLLMGVAISGMMYSKYHGVLVVFFTVLANLKLLRSGLFWLSLVIGLLLFLPHLWWQYSNNFITLRYHLQGRAFSLSFRCVDDYVSQQLVAIGPLIFIPFVYRHKNIFEKTLRFIFIGVLIFFLLNSFRTFIHFHWTSIIIFPLIILAVDYFALNPFKNWLRIMLIFYSIVIIACRIFMIFSFFEKKNIGVDYIHNRKLWAEDIARLAGRRPVVFINNFRESALYSFYSGRMGASFEIEEHKKSQYEIWHYEDSLQGKDILLIQNQPFTGCQILETRMNKPVYYSELSNFSSYYNICVKAVMRSVIAKGTNLSGTLKVTNPRNQKLLFTKNNSPLLYCRIQKDNGELFFVILKEFSEADQLEAGACQTVRTVIPTQSLGKGKYTIRFGFQFGLLPDSYNSESYSITIQ